MSFSSLLFFVVKIIIIIFKSEIFSYIVGKVYPITEENLFVGGDFVLSLFGRKYLPLSRSLSFCFSVIFIEELESYLRKKEVMPQLKYYRIKNLKCNRAEWHLHILTWLLFYAVTATVQLAQMQEAFNYDYVYLYSWSVIKNNVAFHFANQWGRDCFCYVILESILPLFTACSFLLLIISCFFIITYHYFKKYSENISLRLRKQSFWSSKGESYYLE